MAAPPPLSVSSFPSDPPPSYEDMFGFNSNAPHPSPAGPEPVTMAPPPAPFQTIYVHRMVTFQDRPIEMVCPSCKNTIETTLFHRQGTLTWLSCGVLCLLGCWLGCCLIPFYTNPLLDVDHYCPVCNKLLGTHNRL